jgi:stage II sporulation protein D
LQPEKLIVKGGTALKKYQSYSSILIIIFVCLMVIFTGCQQAKKPENLKLAPEVKKYKEEPTISLFRQATGEKQQIKLEEYLKGVVAAEIGPKYPMEALKAQAIVARTMTLALMEYENGAREKHDTDASDDHTEFQAYNEKAITENISKAVEETRGEVLINDGKFIYALFHSTSKDKTADISEGFPELKDKAPYIVPVATNGIKNASDKHKRWTVRVPKSRVKEIMGQEAGSLNDIKISNRGPSGRALTITAGNATIQAVELRKQIGFDKLYSTVLSSVKADGNDIVFTGSGWGHGCGMEQWGAYTMAKEGKTSRQILEHYYPNCRWVKLYD